MLGIQQSRDCEVFNSEILRSPRVSLSHRSLGRRRTIGFLLWFGYSVFKEICWRLRDEEIVEVPKLWEASVDSCQFGSFENV
jgi:hypothetical protein